MVKRFIYVVVVLLAASCVTTFADIDTSEYSEYAISDLNGLAYESLEPVTYNDKITNTNKNFWGFDASSWFNHSTFSWDNGASGLPGDYAPHVEAKSGDAFPFSYDTDMLYLFYSRNRIGSTNPIVNEFDIKLNTNTDSVRWYIIQQFLWHTGTGGDKGWVLFDSDGTIKGTTYKYPTNEWIHLKLIYEPSHSRWNVYVTDHYGEHHIVKDIIGVTRDVGWVPSSGSRVVFSLVQNTTKDNSSPKAGFSLDNYRIYELGEKFIIPSSALLQYDDNHPSIKLSFESKQAQKLNVITTVYDKNSRLIGAYLVPYESKKGSNTFKYTLSSNIDYFESDSTIVYLWDDNLSPLTDGISVSVDGYILKNGSCCIEAEDVLMTNASTYAQQYITDAPKLSGGVGVIINSNEWDNGLNCPAIMYTPIILPKSADPGDYKIWIRQRTLIPDSSSIFVDKGNGNYFAEYYNANLDGEYRWSCNNISLKSGFNYISFKPRTKIIVDKIIITNNLLFTPTQKDDEPPILSKAELEQKYRTIYAEPKIKPVQGHPRLMITKDNIEALKARISNSEYTWMRDKFLRYSKEKLNTTLDTSQNYNYNSMLLLKIECRAFAWLIGEEKDLSYAKETIDYMKEYMRTVRTPDDMGDITRQRGNVLFGAAIVYDWCYDALTDQDKSDFKKYMMAIVSSKEIGWLPTNMSDMASHAGEQEIFRDLLGAGIALYDEYPLLYDVAAGRMFEKMVPARLWLRSAGRFDAGNDYGECRSYSEVWGDYMIQAMGYPSMFGDIGSKNLRSLLYFRMPYGAMMPVGDMYSSATKEYDRYYSNYYLTLAIAGNLYNDPYLKAEFRRRCTTTNFADDVQFWTMFVNKPDVEEKVWDDLPLSIYTTYPLSGIVARTSWQEGLNASTAMSFMDMHEGYVGDHQHVYTGHFQLYYKGLLAMDTGTYNKSNDHNEGYSHRAISANTMLIYDPNETFKSAWGNWTVTNDGGQRLPYDKGSTVSSLDEYKLDSDGIIQNKELEVAQNIKHFIGPNPNTPEFSYITGDLTNAYTDKVSKYTRSMVFIDTNNKDYPAAFIVYDKVKCSSRNFTKKFLLHSEEQPEIDGTKAIIERKEHGFGGRLVNTTLLPSAVNVSYTGGDDNEMFTLSGFNYSSTKGVIEGGKYRIEITPQNKNREESFLNAMYVTDAGNTQDLQTQMLDSNGFVGVNIPQVKKTVLFNKSTTKAGTFSVDLPKGDVLITGIASGRWKVEGSVQVFYTLCQEEAEGLVVNSDGGTYTFTPTTEEVTEQAFETVIKPLIGDFFIRKQNNTYNGEFITLDSPTITKNGVKFIPVSTLTSLGCSVTKTDKGYFVSKNGNSATVVPNDICYKVNGTTKYLNYKPFIENNMLYIYYKDLTDVSLYNMKDVSKTLITAVNN